MKLLKVLQEVFKKEFLKEFQRELLEDLQRAPIIFPKEILGVFPGRSPRYF